MIHIGKVSIFDYPIFFITCHMNMSYISALITNLQIIRSQIQKLFQTFSNISELLFSTQIHKLKTKKKLTPSTKLMLYHLSTAVLCTRFNITCVSVDDSITSITETLFKFVYVHSCSEQKQL